MHWLPPPEPGTPVCGAFDGSEVSDFTGIKLETVDGLIFTPRYGPDARPAIWNPAEWNGRIPRDQVTIAWEEIQGRYELERAYCDPGFYDETSWETEIESWAARWGDERFVIWPTNKIDRMYIAIRRFEADLPTIQHDGCPITATHMANARKVAKPGEKYALGKPSHMQKIDMAVTTVLAHEAAADARAEGWGDTGPSIFFLPS